MGTPIGNLGDLTPRAVATLAAAEVIACEDTRRTRQLMTYAGIPAGRRLVSFYAHNERQRTPTLLEHLEKGETVAVVSDAGMPGISDPGSRLVAAALDRGIEVSVVPGPTAAIAALVVSGMDTRTFTVEAFLPRKGRYRAEVLARIAASASTSVVFESPYRIAATLGDLANACGSERRVAVCRELTKVHEEVWRGNLGEAVAWQADLADRGGRPRGEHVIVVEGAPPAD